MKTIVKLCAWGFTKINHFLFIIIDGHTLLFIFNSFIHSNLLIKYNYNIYTILTKLLETRFVWFWQEERWEIRYIMEDDKINFQHAHAKFFRIVSLPYSFDPYPYIYKIRSNQIEFMVSLLDDISSDNITLGLWQ